MTDNKANNNNKWQNLEWEKKVQICQQGIAGEDSLLITYVVVFIGLEALFFTAFWGLMQHWFSVPGIIVAVWYVFIFKRRGDAVDRWTAILYSLWNKLPSNEELDERGLVKVEDLLKDYEGSFKRLQKGLAGWRALICGWRPWRPQPYFLSARRLLTFFTPLLVVVAWVLVCALNC